MKMTAVLIHGAFGGAWSLENFAEFFRNRGWICHTPNLRCHGEDPTLEPDSRLAEISIADYTNDMAEFIKSLDSVPVIFGFSMGGVIAQKLAALGLAQGMVLLNSSAVWGVLPSTEDERTVATGLMASGPFSFEDILRINRILGSVPESRDITGFSS